MTNNNPDDFFDWSAAEESMRDIVAQETENVALLTDIQLLDRFQTLNTELRDRHEMLRQTTDTGRDLQSQRGAIRVELARRGLM